MRRAKRARWTGQRYHWWQDCRILHLNHWTTHSTDPAWRFQCVECGWLWGRP